MRLGERGGLMIQNLVKRGHAKVIISRKRCGGDFSRIQSYCLRLRLSAQNDNNIKISFKNLKQMSHTVQSLLL